METDVIIVGGGPAGLTLAAELRLGGARALVLERAAELGHTPNANGLGGRIMDLLRHRGLLERFAAAAVDAHPAPIYPFGGLHLDLTALEDPPLTGMQLRHPSADHLLGDRARELGAEIRHRRTVVGVAQDDAGVTAEVEGPDGAERLRARFLVGCDGMYSGVRELAGIGFPGVTYPEVHRLAEVAPAEGTTLRDDGGLEVPGVGTVPAGYTRTTHGVFAFGSFGDGVLGVQTIEDDPSGQDDRSPLTLDELRESVRRVLGLDVPFGPPRRLSRYRHHARQADAYRAGRVLLAGDAAHVLPATGVARSLGMLDAVNLGWKLAAELRGGAPAGLLDTYGEERRTAADRALLQTQAQVALRRGHDDAADALRTVVGELLRDEQPQRRLAALIAGADVRYATPGDLPHPLVGAFVPDLPLRDGDAFARALCAARAVLLVLADDGCPELADLATGWAGRVDVVRAACDDRPADALLVRPDAHVAWAADVGRGAERAVPALRAALGRWFGAPAR